MHPPTMAATVFPRPPWCLNPGAAANDNHPTLGDCFVRRRWEWGTMAAIVGHLGHDISTDVLVFLLSVF